MMEDSKEWDEFDENIQISKEIGDNGKGEDKEVFKIGFLYESPFGARVINNLIDKIDFCTKCGTLCVNCRVMYPWFSRNIYYAHKVNMKNYDSIDKCITNFTKNLIPLDVLIVIGVPKQILSQLPAIIVNYNIKSAIFPIENPTWISAMEQIKIQSYLNRNNVECAFPRPFCALIPHDNHKLINRFINEFKIGYPEFDFSVENGKIIKTTVKCGAPCGISYFIGQYIRHHQFNTWNEASIEKHISDAMKIYPCMASKMHDNVIQTSIRNLAEKIAQDSVNKSLKKIL